MLFALLLALAATAGGALMTYLYDRDAPAPARLAAGAATGTAALGLVGFVLASFAGLTPATLAVSGALAAAPLLLLVKDGELRARVRDDARGAARGLRRAATFRDAQGAATLVLFVLSALVSRAVFARAAYVRGGDLFTGLDNNIGDLPFHAGIVSGFVHGENFPPEHPEYAGARLTYPFIVDFVAAMFVRAGATLEGSLFWQNFMLAVALVVLLWRWASELTRDRLAALFAPALVLLSGGLGFWHFLREGDDALTHYYTMWGDSYKWGNAVTTLLVPQRGLLLGLPVALVVWTLWWKANNSFESRGDDATDAREKARKGKGAKKRAKVADAKTAAHVGAATKGGASPFASPAFRQMLAAGVVAGLLPLVHAHSFVVLMTMGGCLALLSVWEASGRREIAEAMEAGETRAGVAERVKEWAVFFVAALALAVPQMLWATYKSNVEAGSFFGLHVGWEEGKQSLFAFWLKNTGLFIPALVAALLWRAGRERRPLVPARLRRFYLPFTLCLFVPYVFKLSPWAWDNIKVMYYWWVAAAPLVALLVAHLWRRGAPGLVAALALLVVLTLSGALDVYRVASGRMEQRVFSREGVAFAEMVRERTPPRSVILHAPTYNHPVLLTGRRGLVGYAGHLWSHGITGYAERETDAADIYRGGPEAEALLARRGIEYVVVGPLERGEMAARGLSVNEAFFQRYRKVGQVGGFVLYKTARG
ncbi:MAG TPA: hypothetical protein VER32_14450 [Pyrinomonadaceae bacterium]|nr:hypothetical protein [Pyrinomonadaceae bacterium]